MTTPTVKMNEQSFEKLEELYTLANSQNFPDKDQVLKKKAGDLVEMLSLAKLNSVSVAERDLINKLITQITSASDSLSWNQIPPPEKMKQGYKELMVVEATLKLLLNNFLPDIMDIMKQIVAINGLQQVQKIKESILHNSNFIQAAYRQFAATEKANEFQLKSDLTNAHSQIAAGVVTCVAAGWSLKQSAKMVGKNSAAITKTKNLKQNQKKLDSHIAKHTEQQSLLKTQADKTKLQSDQLQARKAVASTQPENPDEEAAIATQEKLIEKAKDKVLKNKEIVNLNEQQLKEFKKALKDEFQIMSLTNTKNQSKASLYQAQGQMIGSLGSIITGAGATSAATDKAEAGKKQLEAQKEELYRSLSQTYSQNSMERARAFAEVINTVIQVIKTMMQAADSPSRPV